MGRDPFGLCKGDDWKKTQEDFERWFRGQVTGNVVVKVGETGELVIGGWIVGNAAGVVFEATIAVPALIPAVNEKLPPFGQVNRDISVKTWELIKETWER